MKRFLSVLCFVWLLTPLRSQVVSCPPGAEWHYNFSGWGVSFNETIKYAFDVVSGPETWKAITSTRIYHSCNIAQRTFTTFIKQRGDTVLFMNESTKGSWEIFYNFAVQPGQSWTTSYTTITNVPKTHTFYIDSITHVTINHVSLKRYHIKGLLPFLERIGGEHFLFMLMDREDCDIGLLANRILCYQDNNFGIHQFSSKPCDFSNLAGIETFEKENFKIFPNPARNKVSVQTDRTETMELILSDLSGRELERVRFQSQLDLPLDKLLSGMFLLSITQDNQLIYTKKLIKE